VLSFSRFLPANLKQPANVLSISSYVPAADSNTGGSELAA
jgi:hypothetical protein